MRVGRFTAQNLGRLYDNEDGKEQDVWVFSRDGVNADFQAVPKGETPPHEHRLTKAPLVGLLDFETGDVFGSGEQVEVHVPAPRAERKWLYRIVRIVAWLVKAFCLMVAAGILLVLAIASGRPTGHLGDGSR